MQHKLKRIVMVHTAQHYCHNVSLTLRRAYLMQSNISLIGYQSETIRAHKHIKTLIDLTLEVATSLVAPPVPLYSGCESKHVPARRGLACKKPRQPVRRPTRPIYTATLFNHHSNILQLPGLTLHTSPF